MIYPSSILYVYDESKDDYTVIAGFDLDSVTETDNEN